MILSSHILSEISAVCSRVMIINNGRIVTDRPIEKNDKELEKLFVELTGGEGESADDSNIKA